MCNIGTDFCCPMCGQNFLQAMKTAGSDIIIQLNLEEENTELGTFFLGFK